MHADQVRQIFARHESFHPRFGWFRKAYDGAADRRQNVFTAADATVQLGVGKNMVRALRFWGLAAKILRDAPNPSRPRLPLTVPSTFGDLVFSANGWDPFLEDHGTVWLLHWLMLRPPCLLPVWWVAFNEFDAVEFDDDDLLRVTLAQIASVPDWQQPHAPSVKKDVDCFLRTYADVGASDEALECPFRSLRLLERVRGTQRTFRFLIGHKGTLPARVLGAAILDFLDGHEGGRTVTLSRLASAPGGPGRVFKLSQEDLLRGVEAIVSSTREISLVTSMGTQQLVYPQQTGRIAINMLARYYRRRPATVIRASDLPDSFAAGVS